MIAVFGFRLAACRTRSVFGRISLTVAAAVAGIGLFQLSYSAHAEDAAKGYEEKIPGSDVSFKLVAIPGGTFTMGSPASEKDRKDDEGPTHEVKVEPFYMEEHETTWAEYNLFTENYPRLSSKPPIVIPDDKMADAVTYPTPIYDVDAAPRFERMGGRGSNFPVVLVSQFAARQYTKWLSKKTGHFYRLPTEAEWEYAARAGTKTAYFFGDDPSKLDEYAWYSKNSVEADGDTGYHPIMKKKPNPWGLYDIYGNAAEWVIDQYNPTWYKQFEGKTVDAANAINWPTKLYPRVLRGGNYDADAPDCRSAARQPTTRDFNRVDPQIPKSPHWMSDGFFIGFRVIRPAKEPSESERNKWWNADDPTTIDTIKRDRERRELFPQAASESK
jgi:formylglycine-generating enzyme required for sulfatase activity